MIARLPRPGLLADLETYERLIERAEGTHGQPGDAEALEELTRLLPEDDGDKLESLWHLFGPMQLIDILNHVWRDREDFFVAANMFLYYSTRQVLTMDFRGPDFFVVTGVERRRPRGKYVVWKEEGKFPNVIIEYLSPSTEDNDLGAKKDLYEQTFQTPEYFCFDPETGDLQGWRLKRKRYQPINPDKKGRYESEQLGFLLATWEGEYQATHRTWLRLYDRQGHLAPRQYEAAKTRADAARTRANTEKARADQAEEEVKRLQEELARLKGKAKN